MGQRDDGRCWLGPGSNDPRSRCGLNSAHPTFASRNSLQFANSLRERKMLPCFCTARQSHVLPCKLGAASLSWFRATVGWVGHENFLQAFFAVSGRLHMQPAALKAT